MPDRTLSKEERVAKLEEVKGKYVRGDKQGAIDDFFSEDVLGKLGFFSAGVMEYAHGEARCI